MVRALCALHEANDPDRFKVRPDVLDRYSAWLPQRAADPRSVFLIAHDDDGTPLGFTVGTIEPEVPIFWIPECGWIHDLWVDPGQRRRGLARALAERAVDRFAELGVAQVRLHTGVFNQPARDAFAAIGFRPCVVEMIRTITPTPSGPAAARPADAGAAPQPGR